MIRSLLVLITYCCSISFCTLSAQPDLAFESWVSGFSFPVDIANAGDGTNRLFIVEQRGIIKIIENNTTLATPFLDIDAIVRSGGERGLLGLAFHPDYENNGFFYVNYTNNQSDTRVSRFSVDPNDANLADVNSEVILLEIEQPFNNHNAGDLNFGPNDGYLYIAVGDGGSGGDPGNRSQDGDCLLGKMLRIDVDGGGNTSSSTQSGGNCDFISSANYTIPSDNPFVSDANVLDEIWSLGLRNPWRFSFDPTDGKMWIADVGQGQWEEVNIEKGGEGGLNYGWRCFEGDHTYNSSGCNDTYTSPNFEYDHQDGWSITGGYVYRGSMYPNMAGYYIMADYGSDKVWALLQKADGSITSTTYENTDINSTSSFGEDESGELYAASLSGTIYKVEDNSVLPVALSTFSGNHKNGKNQLFWTTESEINLDYFEIEKSIDGQTFEAIGKVRTPFETFDPRRSYQFEDPEPAIGQQYYRLKMVDKDRTFEYSPLVNIKTSTPFALSIQPNPNNGKFSILANSKLKGRASLKVYNTKGLIILDEEIEQIDDYQSTLDLSQYPKGIYLIQISTDSSTESKRMLFK